MAGLEKSSLWNTMMGIIRRPRKTLLLARSETSITIVAPQFVAGEIFSAEFVATTFTGVLTIKNALATSKKWSATITAHQA